LEITCRVGQQRRQGDGRVTLSPDLQEKYGRDKYYREWVNKIPHVPFDPDWDVRAIPPFGGALVRYQVRHNGAFVSIYLDGDNSLGYGPDPAYWEVCPFEDDVWRCAIDETDALIYAIRESINQQTKHPLSGEGMAE
jgi:hypothetical protein